MSAKHTPGPWTHTGQGDITGIETNGENHGPVDVCCVYLRAVPGRTEANARLVAAAPDLLDALIAMVDEPQPLGITRPAYKGALTAIAKATGDAP